MASFPRFPLHIGDYLKDTPPICRTNWEHHGIYLLALIIAWTVPHCRLPNDKKWLARRLGCTIKEYDELVKPVVAQYFKSNGKWLWQKRERLEQKFVKKQSWNAKSRKHKEKHPQPESILADATTPIPIPTQVSKESDSIFGSKNPTTERPIIGQHDFCSDDGSIIVTHEEFAMWEQLAPSVKNIRGLFRHALRSWLASHNGTAKVTFERWLRNKQTENERHPPKPRSRSKEISLEEIRAARTRGPA
jgi:uncharacterized protein YdaU (DUF1376 family)